MQASHAVQQGRNWCFCPGDLMVSAHIFVSKFSASASCIGKRPRGTLDLEWGCNALTSS